MSRLAGVFTLFLIVASVLFAAVPLGATAQGAWPTVRVDADQIIQPDANGKAVFSVTVTLGALEAGEYWLSVGVDDASQPFGVSRWYSLTQIQGPTEVSRAGGPYKFVYEGVFPQEGVFYVKGVATYRSTIVERAGSDWLKITVNKSSISKNAGLTLTPSSLDVYPTESNFTVAEVSYKGMDLKSPILLKVEQSLPPGLTVSFAPDELQPESSGVSDFMINVTMDYSKAKGLVPPADYKLTIVASSGDLQVSAVLPLHLLKANWLVMLYAVKDTSPNLPILENVEEMLNVTRVHDTPKVGMVTLIDSNKEWNVEKSVWGVSTIPEDNAQLYQIVNGGLKKLMQDWGPTNMSSVSALRSFVKESMDRFPAEHTQLIIGDHGLGVVGVIWDKHQGYKQMRIPEMARALGNYRLDVISFDACLMAQVEVLYQLRNQAAYFTVSELEKPGPGDAYPRFLEDLSVKPDMSALDYAKKIVQYYGPRYNGTEGFISSSTGKREYDKVNATLSVVDSSKIQNVVVKADVLAKMLKAGYDGGDKVFNETMYQIVLRSWADPHEPYTDLGSFAQNIINDPKITDVKLKDAARSVVNAVSAAVMSHNEVLFDSKGNSVKSEFQGLTILLWRNDLQQATVKSFNISNTQVSITIPHINTQYLQPYQATSFASDAGNWLSFINSFSASHTPSTSWNFIKIVHQQHELYPGIYDEQGRHVGFNSSLINKNRWQIEQQIPGAVYFDFKNGTKIILLPADVKVSKAVVDGQSMEEDKEDYALTFGVVTNGVLTSVRTISSTIERNTMQSMPVKVENGTLTVGEISVSPSIGAGGSILTSTTTTTTSSRTVTSSIATTTTRTQSPEPFVITDSEIGFGFMSLIVLVGAALVLRRRSKSRSGKDTPNASSQPSVAAAAQSRPAQSPAVTGARFCSNCGAGVSLDEVFCSNCGASIKE
ncbi:MAG: zinc-ribbon domain-containing protein [Thaumarchaeota archaeon]|nr:zinc-ribbon domain-containing protein [Nitrososphaerota archaeon]